MAENPVKPKRKNFFSRTIEIIGQYLLGTLLDSAIVGAANFIFMLITGLPNPFIISCIIAVGNAIPTVGPVAASLIGALIVVWYDPWYVLYFLIFQIVIQIIDMYVLKPKIFGKTIGMPAFWVLIATIVGSIFFGFWGLILSVPVAGLLYFIWKEYLFPPIKRKFAALKEKRRLKKEQKMLLKQEENNND